MSIAIIGAGNLGIAMAKGIVKSGYTSPDNITLTRRNIGKLESMKQLGFVVESDSSEAVRNSDIICIAVGPNQLHSALNNMKSDVIPNRHILVSVVTSITIRQIKEIVGPSTPVIRAVTNTAIEQCEAISCLATEPCDMKALQQIQSIFQMTGMSVTLAEDLLDYCTVLGASSVAFYLEAIKATISTAKDMGFSDDDAILIASQSAKGASTLSLSNHAGPNSEISRITTKGGCTAVGLDAMESIGFSSSLRHGLEVAIEKVKKMRV